jgi:hypothetical protein
MAQQKINIIKHGKNSDSERLYFICRKCGCEFDVARKHCSVTHEEFQRDQTITSYNHKCPDCDNIVLGQPYAEYIRLKNILDSLQAKEWR